MSRIFQAIKKIASRVWSRENALAFGLCLIVICIIIATSDSSPAWIYQGF